MATSSRSAAAVDSSCRDARMTVYGVKVDEAIEWQIGHEAATIAAVLNRYVYCTVTKKGVDLLHKCLS